MGLLFLWASCSGLWFFLTPLNSFGKAEFIGIGTLLLFAFCFFSLVKNKQTLTLVCRWVVISSLILATYAIIECVFGSFIPGGSNVHSLEEKIALGRTLFAPTGGYTNTNDLAALLSVAFVILQYRFVVSRHWSECKKLLALILWLLTPSVLISSTIFYTVFFVTSFLSVVIIFWYRKNNPALAKNKIIAYGLMLCLYFFCLRFLVRFIVWKLNAAIFSRRIQRYMLEYGEAKGNLSDVISNNLLAMTKTFDDQLNDFQAGYGTMHIRLWLIYFGIKLFLSHPAIGVGPGNFRSWIQLNDNVLKNTRNIIDPHNFYVELAAEYGLLLFLPFILLFGKALIRSYKQMKSEHRKNLTSMSILSVLMLINSAMICVLPSSIIRFTALWIGFLIPMVIVEEYENSMGKGKITPVSK